VLMLGAGQDAAVGIHLSSVARSRCERAGGLP
jgi:hypothetical protein